MHGLGPTGVKGKCNNQKNILPKKSFATALELAVSLSGAGSKRVLFQSAVKLAHAVSPGSNPN